MKTISKLILGLGLATTLFSACSGSYYVAERPAEPYYVRPASPYADAYWIPGEWVWNGGRYVYVNGHYVHTRRGYTYAPGYWRQGPRGHVWVKGYWHS